MAVIACRVQYGSESQTPTAQPVLRAAGPAAADAGRGGGARQPRGVRRFGHLAEAVCGLPAAQLAHPERRRCVSLPDVLNLMSTLVSLNHQRHGAAVRTINGAPYLPLGNFGSCPPCCLLAFGCSLAFASADCRGSGGEERRTSADAGTARITEEEESFYDAALVVRSASGISRASAQSALSARPCHPFVPTVHVLAVVLSTPDSATVVLVACPKQGCWPATAAACVPACAHRQLLTMEPRFRSSFRDAFQHALQAVTTAKHLWAGNAPLSRRAGWSAG